MDASCPECFDVAKRLIAFGKEYVDDALTPEEAVKRIMQHAEWDTDAQAVISWMKEKSEKHGIELPWPVTDGA